MRDLFFAGLALAQTQMRGKTRAMLGYDAKLMRVAKVKERAQLFGIAAMFAATLSACAGSGDKYPSLAVRDAERFAGSFEPAPSVEPAPVAAPAIMAGLPAIEARADAAYAAFQSALPSAESSVRAARGASQSSNKWSAAQVALADLTAKRSTSAIALADIDLIYAQISSEFTVIQEVAELRARIAAQVNAQDRILDELSRLASQ